MCYSAMVIQSADILGLRFGATTLRDSFAEYEGLAASDPKKYRPLAANPRIFPMYFAPVIRLDGDGNRVFEPMRYQAWPPTYPKDPTHLTFYNARLDNLRSTSWSGMFMAHHGVVVISKFFEWVAVKDLVKSGKITLEAASEELRRRGEARKARIEAQGKRYRPTPTELRPLIERKITVEFKPADDILLAVPCIFSATRLTDGTILKSFAMITDDPPDTVLEAGHDRCPVSLNEQILTDFLAPKTSTITGILDLLQKRSAKMSLEYAIDAQEEI